jgi:hypothetical protein
VARLVAQEAVVLGVRALLELPEPQTQAAGAVEVLI